MLKRMWREDEGVLTFEWILLISLLVIGVVGGLSAVREALVLELGDVAGAIAAVDQTYSVNAPFDPTVGKSGVASCVVDGAHGFYFNRAQTGTGYTQASVTQPAACP